MGLRLVDPEVKRGLHGRSDGECESSYTLSIVAQTMTYSPKMETLWVSGKSDPTDLRNL